MTLKDFYCTTFLDFVVKYSPEIINKAKKISCNPKQLIRSHILKHMEYGTITPYYINGELVGLCNYDIKDTIAYIKNCVVHPKYRNKDILKRITQRALITWPFLQYIEFERPLKNKPRHTITISQLLKVRNPDARHAVSSINTTGTIS